MSLLKTLFKLVFKWLFRLVAAVEPPAEPPQNGYKRPTPERSANGDYRAEAAAENAVAHLRQAIDNFEDSLSRNGEYGTNGATTATAESEDEEDINELRAELAELKADIRSLRRMLNQSSSASPHDDNADD